MVVHGSSRDGKEEMIEIIAKFKSLVHMGFIVKESWRADNIVAGVVVIYPDVEFFHEELIAEGDESTRDIFMDNFVKESALVDLIQHLLVGVVICSHVGMVASSDMESNEILHRLEGFIQEFIDVSEVYCETFSFHLRTTDTNKFVGAVARLFDLFHEASSLQIMRRTTSSYEDSFLLSGAAKGSTITMR